MPAIEKKTPQEIERDRRREQWTVRRGGPTPRPEDLAGDPKERTVLQPGGVVVQQRRER